MHLTYDALFISRPNIPSVFAVVREIYRLIVGIIVIGQAILIVVIDENREPKVRGSLTVTGKSRPRIARRQTAGMENTGVA